MTTTTTTRGRAIRGAMAAGIVALAAALAACAGDGDRDAERKESIRIPEADEAQEIDERLMIPLLQAKNFHRKARVYMTDGNLEQAIAAVRQIFALEFPAGAPEREDVRLDAYAMLAKLLVAGGKVDDAMTTVDQGIAEATRDSFFLANLHTVRGEIWQARAALLEDDGSEQALADARAAKRAAIEAFDRSNQILEAVQQRLLEQLRQESP